MSHSLSVTGAFTCRALGLAGAAPRGARTGRILRLRDAELRPGAQQERGGHGAQVRPFLHWSVVLPAQFAPRPWRSHFCDQVQLVRVRGCKKTIFVVFGYAEFH